MLALQMQQRSGESAGIGGVMASRAKKTEHAGPKKGRGAYYGRKRDAKRDSRKRRRHNDRLAVLKRD
jgi:hypothetical protein